MSAFAANKTESLFLPFVRLLREYGLPVSFHEVMSFYEGLGKGLVEDLDSLLVFSRLNFVKRVEHMDAFERAFAFYFYGIDIPAVAEGDWELFRTRQFHEWLAQAVKKGDLPKSVFWDMPHEELMKRFWDTIREQMESHQGGSRWVGTGGNSPFGHSGASKRGIRVDGESRNRSALKVIGERRYVDYASTHTLRGENLRQALAALKNMTPAGPRDSLDLDETIRATAKNGGDIELIFSRALRNKIKVVLLLDNGGYSMMPFVNVTRLLFSKMRNQFRDFTCYYFHNTIYGALYKDPRRSRLYATAKLLQRSPDTRIIILGDASMAPEELAAPNGAIDFYADDDKPSQEWLKRIKERFSHSVWLNPIPQEDWPRVHGQWTLARISEIFQMEELTLRGIKRAVEYLSGKF